jgi:hypothetical protein
VVQALTDESLNFVSERDVKSAFLAIFDGCVAAMGIEVKWWALGLSYLNVADPTRG